LQSQKDGIVELLSENLSGKGEGKSFQDLGLGNGEGSCFVLNVAESKHSLLNLQTWGPFDHEDQSLDQSLSLFLVFIDCQCLEFLQN